MAIQNPFLGLLAQAQAQKRQQRFAREQANRQFGQSLMAALGGEIFKQAGTGIYEATSPVVEEKLKAVRAATAAQVLATEQAEEKAAHYKAVAGAQGDIAMGVLPSISGPQSPGMVQATTLAREPAPGDLRTRRMAEDVVRPGKRPIAPTTKPLLEGAADGLNREVSGQTGVYDIGKGSTFRPEPAGVVSLMGGVDPARMAAFRAQAGMTPMGKPLLEKPIGEKPSFDYTPAEKKNALTNVKKNIKMAVSADTPEKRQMLAAKAPQLEKQAETFEQRLLDYYKSLDAGGRRVLSEAQRKQVTWENAQILLAAKAASAISRDLIDLDSLPLNLRGQAAEMLSSERWGRLNKILENSKALAKHKLTLRRKGGSGGGTQKDRMGRRNQREFAVAAVHDSVLVTPKGKGAYAKPRTEVWSGKRFETLRKGGIIEVGAVLQLGNGKTGVVQSIVHRDEKVPGTAQRTGQTTSVPVGAKILVGTFVATTKLQESHSGNSLINSGELLDRNGKKVNPLSQEVDEAHAKMAGWAAKSELKNVHAQLKGFLSRQAKLLDHKNKNETAQLQHGLSSMRLQFKSMLNQKEFQDMAILKALIKSTGNGIVPSRSSLQELTNAVARSRAGMEQVVPVAQPKPQMDFKGWLSLPAPTKEQFIMGRGYGLLLVRQLNNYPRKNKTYFSA